MNEISRLPEVEEQPSSAATRPRRWPWVAAAVGIALAGAAWFEFSRREGGPIAQAAVPPSPVTVSRPLERDVDTQIRFLGQFSAVDRVELRAQVGGTLAEIHFEDGQIVKKGDLLFVIDPTPYEIKLAQVTAQLAAAQSRLVLANSQLYRA
ncbi:MAG TPA: biotin/lipoyl-binding protein, partial [Inquilinus sp.]